ncbi:Phospholipid-transporting ATPase 10 [Diplonema papillatum]|nr:Phospholipid-transporting ATPase 10 [Diplonema papillatum]
MALPAQGLTGYTAVIFVVTLKCALEASSWTWITTLIFVGSLASWFAFLLVYCTLAIEFDTPLIWYLIYNDFQYPLVWLTVALSIAIALLRDFAWKAYVKF